MRESSGMNNNKSTVLNATKSEIITSTGSSCKFIFFSQKKDLRQSRISKKNKSFTIKKFHFFKQAG